eukprot:3452843-Pyramimonas_sp.AAC.1
MTLDFTAVCGSNTQQVLDGRIDFDQANGLVHSRRDDRSLSITLTKNGAIYVAAQYVMEHTSYRPDTNETERLQLTEVTHYVPEDVRQTTEWNWEILVQDLELGLRIIRVIVIIREFINCFIAEGYYIAHPSAIFLARGTDVEYADDKRLTDSYALDCRIRAAIETYDLIEEWAHDLGRQGRADIRRQGMKLQGAIHWLYPYVEATELQDKDEGPFRSARGKCGTFAATAARGVIRHARKQRVTSVRERRGADGPSDGQAVTEGIPLARARPSPVVRPDPPPPPRRPDVQDDRANDGAT